MRMIAIIALALTFGTGGASFASWAKFTEDLRTLGSKKEMNKAGKIVGCVLTFGQVKICK